MNDAVDPVDIAIGGRIRTRREELRITQAQLAAGAGVTFQQIQKYEKGTNRIGASRLQQISIVLGVPVAFFFEGAPTVGPEGEGLQEEQSPAYVSDFLATSDGLTLTRNFMRISDARVRRRIVDLVIAIAGETEA